MPDIYKLSQIKNKFNLKKIKLPAIINKSLTKKTKIDFKYIIINMITQKKIVKIIIWIMIPKLVIMKKKLYFK